MKYEYTNRVRYSETDENARLTIGALVNYLQDTSTFQSEEVGYGINYLRERGQGWILASWQIVLDELPALGDAITTKTWAYDFKGFMGLRNYVVTSGEKRVACANAIWLLYDMHAGRPVRIDQDMARTFAPEEPYAMDYAPRKIDVPEGGEQGSSFYIEKQHLDTNHHVNNVQYIQFALREMETDEVIRQIRTEYKAQARLGDRITPYMVKLPGRTVISLNDDDHHSYAVIELATA